MDTKNLPIQSVKLDTRHGRVIKILTSENLELSYYMNSNGILELGQPLVTIYEKYTVYFFLPLAPGSFPIVLDVTDNATH